MRDDVNNGKRNCLYRSGTDIREKKAKDKSWANTWFLCDNTKSTISCPTTPGSQLKISLNKVVNPVNSIYRTQVIEDGGMPVHCGLMVRDPMRPSGCIYGDPNCMITSNQRCDQSGCIYRIECITCNNNIEIEYETKRYIGMTRTTLHNRMLSHLKTQQSKCNSSPLFRHDRDSHGGEKQKYVMYKIGSEKKIVRLACLEALEIEKQPGNLLLNERNEHVRTVSSKFLQLISIFMTFHIGIQNSLY